MEWAGLAGMLASKTQKKKECKKWTGRSLACKPKGNKKISDIIAEAMQWHGRSTSQPMDTGQKGT